MLDSIGLADLVQTWGLHLTHQRVITRTDSTCVPMVLSDSRSPGSNWIPGMISQLGEAATQSSYGECTPDPISRYTRTYCLGEVWNPSATPGE